MIHANRAAWILIKGPIPKGIFVCHKCDVRACCNINHLFLGTHQDNIADAVQKGKFLRGENHVRNKLTEKQVKEIREKYKPGISFESIARKYGVSWQNIQSIVKRQIWKHVI